MIAYPHSVEIDIGFGHLSDIIQWCQDNCQSDWTFNIDETAGGTPGKYHFMFDDEKDCFAFLVWKK